MSGRFLRELKKFNDAMRWGNPHWNKESHGVRKSRFCVDSTLFLRFPSRRVMMITYMLLA